MDAPHFRLEWLALIGFLPQLFIFFMPGVQAPPHLASVALLLSQTLLLIFAVMNLRTPGFWLLALGLGLNLLVIALNGGLMPISPEVVARLAPDAPEGAWMTGDRLGDSKNVVLAVNATRAWWLSDRFLAPGFFPQRVAYSIGDVLLLLGAAWMFWALGGPSVPYDLEET